MSYHQFQMFEKIGTEESQIETSIELSEIVNLFIKQNTYFLSNSPNDLILSCTNISLALLSYVPGIHYCYFYLHNYYESHLMYYVLDG